MAKIAKKGLDQRDQRGHTSVDQRGHTSWKRQTERSSTVSPHNVSPITAGHLDPASLPRLPYGAERYPRLRRKRLPHALQKRRDSATSGNVGEVGITDCRTVLRTDKQAPNRVARKETVHASKRGASRNPEPGASKGAEGLPATAGVEPETSAAVLPVVSSKGSRRIKESSTGPVTGAVLAGTASTRTTRSRVDSSTPSCAVSRSV